MFRRNFYIISLIWLLLPFYINGQQLTSSFTSEKLEKGRIYCNDLDFKTVTNQNTFLYCKDVYTRKNNYREALHVMQIADRKFPYAYKVRLEKALALKQMGSTAESTREFTGLIQLYPHKFELHNYLARIQYDEDRIKSVMPFIVSVISEPRNPVAAENLIFIKRLLNSKSISAEIARTNNLKIAKNGDNNFDLVYYEITRNPEGQDIKNDQQYLKKRMHVLINSLENTTTQKSGFFWNYYGEYLIQLKKENLVDAAVEYMYNRPTGDKTAALQNLNARFGLK